MSDRWCVAFAAAIALGAHLGGGPSPLVGLVLGAIGLVAGRPWLLCLAGAIAAAGLAARADAAFAAPLPTGPVRAWVTLLTDPAPLPGGAARRFDVRLDGRRLEASARGDAAAAVMERAAGERVLLSGSVQSPPPNAGWLRARHVVGRLAVDDVERWAPGSPVSRLANGVRRTLAAGAEALPPDRRALFTGVVLGDDRGQPADLADDFRAAGLTHLLAVSGQNVAFLLAVAGPLLRRLSWRGRLPATLAVLGFFALLTRFEPSVLRATAMAAIATVAAAIGRPQDGVRLLAIAVGALLLIDPFLVRSVGFGLSVGASAGIVLLAPRIERSLPGPAPLRAALAVTVAAQAGVAPILVPVFGSIPVATLPANLLAVPAAGPLMMWGLTGGMTAGLVGGGPLRSALHAPSELLLWWLAGVARHAAELPLGELSALHVVVIGAGVALRVAGRHWRLPALPAVGLAAAAVVVLLPLVTQPTPPGGRSAPALGVELWRDGRRTAAVLDGRARAGPALEALRRSGARCVGTVVVRSEAASTLETVAALARRCPSLEVRFEGRGPPR